MKKGGRLKRSILLTTVLLYHFQVSVITCQSRISVTGVRDKAIDRAFLIRALNMAGKSFSYCLARCLEDCLCKSFQVCHVNECELSSRNKHEVTQSAFQSRMGCVYYEIDSQDTNNQQCDQTSCSRSINCCLTSNPCLHGGVCRPANSIPSTTGRTRFSCKCPQPYTGPRCNQTISSCLGYKNGTRKSGQYKIFNNGASYNVYCDFDSITSLTWTLIQSHEKATRMKPYFVNSPQSPDFPSWTNYRLQKSRMLSIQADSTKWRITCQYNHSSPLTDYVYGASDDLDIMKWTYGCAKVEFIKIREKSCYDCTVYFYQPLNFILHFYSKYKTQCEFSVTGEQTTGCTGADYFGDFTCTDEKHSCSSSQHATTQTWFGGH